MKNKRLPIWIIVCCLMLSISAAAASNLLKNGELDGNGPTEGWSVLSYLPENYSVTVTDGIAMLSSDEPNDLRLIQSVKVEEKTSYILTAEVSAQGVMGGRGASLSIDNFSIDGCYIYSKSILGSVDWTRVELVFRTGDGQTKINAALRLGGYSEMSTGTVRFRNICLEKAGEGMAAIPLMGDSDPGSSTSVDEELTQARKIQLKSYLHLFIVISVFSAVVMIFGIYRNRERIGTLNMTDSFSRKTFLLAVLAGLILRTVLASAWGGHDSDMSCWSGWGSYIAAHGPAAFYTTPGHEWYDYPPGYMLVLGVIARILNALSIQPGTAAGVFAYMLPAYLADIASACLIMRAAKNKGFSNSWQLLMGCICLFNPAIVMLSGAWGQIDSILTFFLLWSMVELMGERRVLAGVLFALAIMTKWQALIYGPVLAAAYILHIRTKRDILTTIGGVLAAFAVIFLISLPFKGDQNLFWIIGRFMNAAGGYDYASVEAYNFLSLCGGNWRSSGSPLLPGISFKLFGIVAIATAVCVSLLLVWHGVRRTLTGESPAGSDKYMVYLASAFCMFTIFTFGHYMHERYIFPVILLLIMVFVHTRKEQYLLCSLALSAVVFLNEMTAMYVISNLASSVVRGGAEHNAVVRVCSVAECAVYAYFLYSLIKTEFDRSQEGGKENA